MPEVPSPADALDRTADAVGGDDSLAQTPGGVAPDHAAAEGAPTETSTKSSTPTGTDIREMLLSTEPDAPLAQIEHPWNPSEGGPRRIYRGLQKMTDVDGMPAVVDLVIGIAEVVVTQQETTSDESDDEDDEMPADVDLPNLGAV